MRKRRIVLGLLILALLAGVGYRVYRLVVEKKDRTPGPAVALVAVRVAPVEKGNIRRDIRLTGDVEAMTSVQVFPKAPGRLIGFAEKDLEIIRTLYEEGVTSRQPLGKAQLVEEADPVEKNQVIAVIDHEAVDAQVDQAKATLTTANAQLTQAEVAREQAERDLERFRNLYKEGGTSKQSLDKIEAEYKSLVEQENVAKARVEQSKSAQSQAQIQLAECYILAPISGIISEKYLETGDMAMVSRPIFGIINVDKVEVTTDLSERYLGQVRKGADASLEVDAFPQRQFKGTVTNISPVLNIVNRTAKLEITVENSEHELKPGMFARITLTIGGREGVPVVPEAAVLRDRSGEYVFVVKGSTAQQRKVKLGLEEGPRVEVVEGLRPGEMLVVAGHQKLSSGQRVQVQQ